MPRSIDRHHFLKDIVVAATTVAALGSLAACAPEKSPPVAAAPADPSDKTPSAEPTKHEWLPARGDYLALEKLAQLETPEEIESCFEFQDGDFADAESMARLDTYRSEAFLNAGTTDEEWAPYKGNSTINAFADAQNERYTVAMMKGIHAKGLTNENFMDLRYGVLQLVDASHTYAASDEGLRNGVAVYDLHRSFVEVVSSEGSVKSGEMTVTYRFRQDDNLEQTQLTKLQDYNSASASLIKTVTMKRQDNGVWKTTASTQKPE